MLPAMCGSETLTTLVSMISMNVGNITVTATNTGTGNTLEVVTDGQGNYTFRNLLPGIYDVGASLQGFRELKQTGLRVSAGNPVRVELKLESPSTRGRPRSGRDETCRSSAL